jgi:hypothetical protein
MFVSSSRKLLSTPPSNRPFQQEVRYESEGEVELSDKRAKNEHVNMFGYNSQGIQADSSLDSLDLDQSYESLGASNNGHNGYSNQSIHMFEENALQVATANTTNESSGGYHSWLQREEQLFAQALLQSEGQRDVFSMVDAFQNILYDRYCTVLCIYSYTCVSVVAQRNLGISYDKPQALLSLQQLREQERLSLLTGERNTWLLLHDLERDRQTDTIDASVTHKVNLSDRKVFENEIIRDRELRQNMVRSKAFISNVC